MSKIPEVDAIRTEVITRWNIPDWGKRFPWWPRPPHVKVLFYADGGIQYDGGPFFGLKQVIATLTAQHYPWVVFDVTTANRLADPSADHSGLDLSAALALGNFDELWIYSYDAAPQLTSQELASAQAFMDTRKGGVLITGDHASLGAAFGNLPRAGKMRQLPAPPSAAPTWNTTLRSGANSLYEFEDQSDAYPQPLTLRWYWAWLPFWRAPHPVLCSPLGPIDIFPDHQHEGESLAPTPSPSSEWPGGLGADVIAWGTIVDPSSSTVGRRVGVLSAYNGHSTNVGRILADSTWHHHFDINLRGLGTPGRTGFVNPGTPDWLTTAKKIEHYFVNAAIWLAPPDRQAQMRAAAWWPILWGDIIAEAQDVIGLPYHFGRAAYDALGRYAPQCVRFGWLWELIPPFIQRELPIHIPRPDPPPLLEYIAAEVTKQMAAEFRVSHHKLPPAAPSLEEIDRSIRKAVPVALERLAHDTRTQANSLATLLTSKAARVTRGGRKSPAPARARRK